MTSSDPPISGNPIAASAPAPITKSETTTSTTTVGDTNVVFTTTITTTIIKNNDKAPATVNKRSADDVSNVQPTKQLEIDAVHSDVVTSVINYEKTSVPTTSSSTAVKSGTSAASTPTTLITRQATSNLVKTYTKETSYMNSDSDEEYEELKKENKVLLSVHQHRTGKTSSYKVSPDMRFEVVKQKIVEDDDDIHLLHHGSYLTWSGGIGNGEVTPRMAGMKIGRKYSLDLWWRQGPPCLVCIEAHLKKMLAATDRMECSKEYELLRAMVNGVDDNFASIAFNRQYMI